MPKQNDIDDVLAELARRASEAAARAEDPSLQALGRLVSAAMSSAYAEAVGDLADASGLDGDAADAQEVRRRADTAMHEALSEAEAGSGGAGGGPDPNAITITVREGQSLSRIAVLYGQAPNEWPRLFHLNRDRIAAAQEARGELPANGEPNPNLIYPGAVLLVPPEWRQAKKVEKITVSVNRKAALGLGLIAGMAAVVVLSVAALSRRRAARRGVDPSWREAAGPDPVAEAAAA